ncbi:hypothetical protein F5883DRAFT_706962 [Diaporthe sp. PMI_573]|nr:hypothetical protein F5883DRAFT_706962 [Diaporthaceae sp. PMI_573]
MGSVTEPIYEDVMGQWPQLKTYNHGCALYKAIGVARDDIIKEWENATDKLAEQIPWLAQQVVHMDVRPGHTGKFHVVPWPSDLPPNKMLRVKNCTELLPSYQDLHDSQFPVQKLDGKIICPVPGFPMTYKEEEIGPAPACIIQLNFITDGVIVTFSNHLNVMDGTGIFNVVGMIAHLIGGGSLPPQVIKQGNRDPATVIPLYPSDHPIKDQSYLRVFSPVPTPLPPKCKTPAKWLAVRFHKDAIPQVKTLAQDPASYDTSVPFISSRDAVSALYWKTLARVRVSLSAPAATRTNYMGQMVFTVATYRTYGELLALPLAAVASLLRGDLNEANTEHSARSYATFLAGEPDKTKITYAGPFDRGTDVASSSMAQAALVLQFGRLGAPEFIRRPNLFPLPGTLYFYPPEASGDLNLLVCLSEEIKGLKRMRYGGNALRSLDDVK